MSTRHAKKMGHPVQVSLIRGSRRSLCDVVRHCGLRLVTGAGAVHAPFSFWENKRDTPVLVSLAGTVVVSESFRYPRLVRCSRGQ